MLFNNYAQSVHVACFFKGVPVETYISSPTSIGSSGEGGGSGSGSGSGGGSGTAT